MTIETVSIRVLSPEDHLDEITDLIHKAYALHKSSGLSYWGTRQTVEDTAKRFASGQGYIAETAGRIVGTLTLQHPQPDSPVALYRAPATRMLAQFAVLPAYKGQGIGKRLHDDAIKQAARAGARTIALDTAAPASRLIALYEKWGYTTCGECDWRPHTNYTSVVMKREL